MATLVTLLVLLFVALNAYATSVLFASPRYDDTQKGLQLFVIWLLPVVGAVLVWSLARDAASPRATTDLANHSGFDDGDIRLDNYGSGDGHGGDAGGGDGGGGD